MNDITILVKSFLRLGMLRDCLESIAFGLPSVRILVVDDSSPSQHKTEYAPNRGKNVDYIFMPFDSGFGAKANEAIQHIKTPYVLIASDDFNFDTLATAGVSALHHVLSETPSMAIASGRVNNNPYEFLLHFGPDWCSEKAGYYSEQRSSRRGYVFKPTDLTVNYSLIRTEILGFGPHQVHWDGDVKIGGGEHGAFFIDCYQQGHKVCYVPGVNINELPSDPRKMDPRYPDFRGRARQPGRICLKRRGIERYQLGDGSWEQS